MQLRFQFQKNKVADEVAAITAVVRPILEGLLYALKYEIVQYVGGYEKVPLLLLPRLYKPGDGDVGLCFEYAVHDALRRRDPDVMERINDAAKKFCKVRGTSLTSLLFGLEKTGALNLIDSVKEALTEESRILTGHQSPPPKLRKHIDGLAAAFRKQSYAERLPSSISGLWKADLFIGATDSDQWVGTSVKINPTKLESAAGLRIGIVPIRGGRSDKVRKDEAKNLVVCPLPHDGSFMEIYYQGWGVVQQVLNAGAVMPREVFLPRTTERQVARYLVDRREFPVVDVIEALAPLAQPELLNTEDQPAVLENADDAVSKVHTGAVLAPVPIKDWLGTR